MFLVFRMPSVLITLLTLINFAQCANSFTQSNTSIYDVRFLLLDGSILQNYYESGKTGVMTVSCKASTNLGDVELNINVLYSSSGSKSFKVESKSGEASIEFKIPQDLVINCYSSSSNAGTDIFTRRFVYKGRSTDNLPARSLPMASSSESDFELNIVRSPSYQLYAGQNVQVECSLSFLLPRQQLLTLINANQQSDGIRMTSHLEKVEITDMKMTIKITALFKTETNVDEETFLCRAQDSTFKQIGKSANATIKFKQPIKTMEIFSFCRAFTTKHMCVIEGDGEISPNNFRWLREKYGVLEYFNNTGSMLKVNRDPSIQQICCEVQLVIRSVNYTQRNCREVQESCFKQEIATTDISTKEVTFTTQNRIGRIGVVQRYVVPRSGCYLVILLGAAGGTEGNITPCKGAKVEATIKFTAGQVLNIVVGQRGIDASRSGYGGGGGGGSFVYSNSTLFAAAGGAGGQESSYKNKCEAPNSRNGGNAYSGSQGGIEGNGGNSGNEAGAGAGWLSSGNPHSRPASGLTKPSWTGGQGFVNCGDGGFGGGGGGHDNSAGGGGGYSGGGGSDNYAGGGGGSFCLNEASKYCVKFGSFNSKDGLVKISGPIKNVLCS